MPSESTQKAPRKPTARSRVTNGSSLGEGIDGRTVWARRLRDVLEDYTDDLMLPRDSIPNSIKSMIRRAAVLTVELERAEAGFAENGKADPTALNEYQRTANSLRRLLESLNVKPPEKLMRGVTHTIENGRFIRSVVDKMTPVDWALCHGRQGEDDGDPDLTPTPTVSLEGVREARKIARDIAWAITSAKRDGTPLPPDIADFAVKFGFAEYDTDKESQS